MTLDEYQQESKKTALYPKDDKNLNYPISYPVMGLVSEAGEVAGKVKKVIRDNGGIIDDTKKADIASEIGDVLWYTAQLCTELGLSFDDVAKANLEKLFSRKDRGAIGGSGDNR